MTRPEHWPAPDPDEVIDPREFKVWLEIEDCNHADDRYDKVGWPICLGTFSTHGEALRLFRVLATLFPENNDDYAYPIEEVEP